MTNLTRKSINVTFLGDENEAPDDWWRECFKRAWEQLAKKKTSGKIFLYKDDKVLHAKWELVDSTNVTEPKT